MENINSRKIDRVGKEWGGGGGGEHVKSEMRGPGLEDSVSSVGKV